MPHESFEVKLERAKAKELAMARLKKHRQSSSVLETSKAITEPLETSKRSDVESTAFKQLEEQYHLPVQVKAEPTEDDGKTDVLHSTKFEQNSYLSLRPATKRKRTALAPIESVPAESAQKNKTKLETDLKFGKRPFAPSKKPTRGQSSYDIIIPIETRSTLHSSDSYQQIGMKQKHSRSDLESLRYLMSLIRQCTESDKADREALFSRLRQRLHQTEFFDFLSGVLIKKSKLLENEGLPTIFEDSRDVKFPFDIKADALSLHQRWLAGRLDPHLLVGIDLNHKKNTNGGKETKSRSLQRGYPAKVSCNYVGEGNLQNGQWWPLQICAMRDGAHGEIEAGIHGQTQNGAYSIVLSSGGYADVDNGDTIKYCGTSGSEGKATAGTNHLKKSAKLGNPVRVLRSATLLRTNPYRPPKGLRYDGLYDVVDYKVLDEDTAMCQFSLVRRPNQDPIRFQGVEQRPTNEELLENTKIRERLGLSI